ncbi:hypothetical protein B0I21_10796 [Sphingobacterium paludis]|uniref:SprT-like family protein n=2 Tax=Sphingobacterium paludis TaxID=1476465 RepID=A0A4R7CTL3_9SPHI|nr:hypothetical protein B0I21_10796 [Sphingobacterium paludis]
MISGYGTTAAGDPVIYLNSNEPTIAHVPDIAIVATMLHEAIHAYLLVYDKNDPSAAKLKYPELFTNYQKNERNFNKTHHTIMARDFISDLAKALKSFGEANKYDIDKQVYDDLAWKGLTNGDAEGFNSLSETDKYRINRRILAEQYGIPKDEINIEQVGKALGCK